MEKFRREMTDFFDKLYPTEHKLLAVSYTHLDVYKRQALTHNHPGGTMAPSSEDVQTTHLVGEAMRGIEVSLVDHIIVAGRKFLSLRQENVLPEKIWGGISAEKYFRNRSEKLTQRVEEQKGGTA